VFRDGLALSCVIAAAVAFSAVSANAQPKLAKGAIPQDASPEVRQLLERCYASTASARGDAADGLGELKELSGPAIPHLMSMLGDDESYMKTFTAGTLRIPGTTSPGGRAAVALGKIGGAAVEPLLKLLADRTQGHRDRAAMALGIAKDPRAVQPLIRALLEKEAPLRAAAAEALGGLKDRRAVEPLIGALGDPQDEVSRGAQSALEELTEQKLGKDAARWQEWWKANRAQ